MPLDLWVLHLLNAAVGGSEDAFFFVMQLSDRPPWLLAAFLVVAMWHAADRGPETPPGITVQEAHRRVLGLFGAMVLAFVLARVLQSLFDRARPMLEAPLEVPIPSEAWAQVQENVGAYGSFPSDHAALLFLLATGMYSLNRVAGVLAFLAALFFNALRVSVGFHWPSDILGGALIGIAAALFTLRVVVPLLRPALDLILRLFDRVPFLAYPVAWLVVYELSQKFSDLFALAYAIGAGWLRH